MGSSTTAATDLFRSQLAAALRDHRAQEVDQLLAEGPTQVDAVADGAVDGVTDDAAEAAEPAVYPDLPAELLAAASDLLMRAQRWSRAAQVLSLLTQHSPAYEMRRRLAANLAAIHECRPRLYDILLQANQVDSPYRVASAQGGAATLVRVGESGKAHSLSPGNDPVAAVQRIRQQLDAFVNTGQPVGLAGLGDGYLLLELARSAPKLLLDQQHPVFLFEPEAALVFAALMIHDYSDADGPIAQPRFRWFVGPDWGDHFAKALDDDPFMLGPVGMVGLGEQAAAIQKRAEQCMQGVSDKVKTLRDRLGAHYGALSLDQIIAPFSPIADGRPRASRVLVITSRLTTVLQYAARDVQAAFDQLGWETELLIEPSAHQQVTTHAIIDAIDRLRPDLIFKIDHLNYESNGLFPPQVPTVCWIQDHMPQLTCEKAGRSIDPREFALTFSGPMFIDRYQYPPEHVIDMPMMLARPQTLPATWTNDGDDLVYASNVSKPADRLARDVVEHVTDAERPLAKELCDALLAIYERGENVPTHHELDRLAQRLMACSSQFACPPEVRHNLVQRVWTQLNIALYRQQALGWVVDAADDLGLSVALYGHGWEDNPRFARFARGFMEPGEGLAQLIRSAKVNLNLEPYPCFTHHRLLDGLMSGGFFLVREHPGNRLLPAISELLFESFDDSVQTAEQARAQAGTQAGKTSPSSLRDTLDALLADAARLTYDGSGDAVRQVRCWQRAGVLTRGQPAMAHLDEVSFADPEGLRTCLDRFIHDEPARRAITVAQRRGVEERLTFPVGMRRLVTQLHQRLAAEKK